MEDHPEVTEEDASLAAQLVLAHRAQCLPTEEQPAEEQAAEDDSPDPDDSERQDPSGTELQDVVLEATRAAIPDGLLAAAADLHRSRRKTGGHGRNGVKRASQKRGRPVGMVPADRVKDGRINLLATLKAALPWQTIRRQQAKVDRPLHLRKADLQVTRFKDCNESTTVFVVDASGSQAAQRLGEVKGAIELLLAECYVRRDQVALIVFRGNKAEVVLAPTRALARAKKTLAAIPAGGGTPLSAGIDLARELVESVRRQGRTPKVVFLTDGRANIARDGSKNREFASSEALQTARLFGGMGIKPIVVDSSRRPRVSAEELADAMRALYLPMPYADAAAINAAVAHHGKI
jgi:magnesium chelatase subunit D